MARIAGIGVVGALCPKKLIERPFIVLWSGSIPTDFPCRRFSLRANKAFFLGIITWPLAARLAYISFSRYSLSIGLATIAMGIPTAEIRWERSSQLPICGVTNIHPPV